MEVYNNFEIEGGASSLEKCMRLIGDSLSGDWVRDTDRENRYKKDIQGYGDVKEVFCIKCPGTTKYPSATIWLIKGKEDIKVTNIIPHNNERLSYAQYNQILDDFYKKFIEKAIKETGVSLVKGKGDLTLEEVFGKGPAKLLKSFSAGANKGTGSSHPCDQARWFEFIISSYKNDSKFSTEDLQRFLLDDGWSEDLAVDLACEYEFAKALLKKYDSSE